MEEIEDVTYEEWLRASRFARFKFKWGLLVLVLCWLSLIVLIIFVIVYARELSEHPINYMMNKFNLNTCTCWGANEMYLVNDTVIMITENPYNYLT
jgi:hypothetical protein